MPVAETLKEINDVIKQVAEFIKTDETVKPDFDEYIKTMGTKAHSTDFQAACFNYIFERRLTEDRKSIIELYLENVKKIPADTKKKSYLCRSNSSIGKFECAYRKRH